MRLTPEGLSDAILAGRHGFMIKFNIHQTFAFFQTGNISMQTFLLILLNLHIGLVAGAQTTLTWAELSEVQFQSVFVDSLGIELQTATFSDHLRSFEGKEIYISGFMIPVDAFGTRYVLSRFPNANCFFCGNAGPETIIELRLVPKSVRRYATDTQATFKGRLQLNTQNLETFNYVLLDAEKI